MKTVAYVTNTFPSPVEPYVMDEITELRRRGVCVVCCSGKRGSWGLLTTSQQKFWTETNHIRPLKPRSVFAAVRRLHLGKDSVLPVLAASIAESRGANQVLRTLAHTVLGAAIAEELHTWNVDHIHAHHGYYASWMALIASRLLGVGFSFTLHGSDLLLHGNLLATKLRYCDFCVTVSQYNRNYILHKFPQVDPSRILVERLGVDTFETKVNDGPERKNSTPLLLCVGRLHTVKNHEFLIQACSVLRDQGRDFLCAIAGDGPEREKLTRLIAALQLEARVRLLGHVRRNALAEMYRNADVVVLTSRSEGIPVVLMEAMAAGSLVLAPNITGIPELVQHTRNGYLYREGSMPEFIATLRWILEQRFHLTDVRLAAIETTKRHYDRRQNLNRFARNFLEQLAGECDQNENPLLQQVQLSL